jgi:hypothetical protein
MLFPKVSFRDPSVIFLVAANLIIIVFAVTENWPITTIMWIYWSQSLIIGFFNVIKMLTAKVKVSPQETLKQKAPKSFNFFHKLFLAGFFCIHFGAFHFAYFEFLKMAPFSVSVAATETDFSIIFFTSILFFVNHLFSYFYNFIIRKEREMNYTALGKLFVYPYIRIVPMHLTIIFGGLLSTIGFIFGFKEASFVVLLLFLFLKTSADLLMHNLEHNRKAFLMNSQIKNE